ncbi:hypothetical protein Csa_017012 [Cucumis sativus]|uniref:Uncharacterized protein n=1 Tax=Cucumis sativus TaxID=3659 RepID=A0A0A0KBZ6_CUCSA|nr:hypothetical protein Csa_017012 [Cucumis sativus]
MRSIIPLNAEAVRRAEEPFTVEAVGRVEVVRRSPFATLCCVGSRPSIRRSGRPHVLCGNRAWR